MAASGVSVMEFLIELLWVTVLYLCMFQMNRGFIIIIWARVRVCVMIDMIAAVEDVFI